MTREELCAKREEVLANYASIGKVISCERYGNGHINDTFLVITESGKRFIFQRINHMVFPRPDQIMENISGVTAHIRKKVAALGGDVLLCYVNDGVLATTSQPLLRELRPIRDNLWKEQK